MPNRQPAHPSCAPIRLSAGLLLGVFVSTLLYFEFDLDLLAISGVGIPCPFRAVTGLVCPGCGMTRALLLVSQLQWGPALRMNPLVFLLLGFAAVSLAEQVSMHITQRMPGRTRSLQPAIAPRPEGLPARIALPALGLVVAHWFHALAA